MSILYKSAAISAMVALLSACGGGGSSDDSETVLPLVPPPTTTITPPPPNPCNDNDTAQCARVINVDNPFLTGTVNSANDLLDYVRYTPSVSGSLSITLDNYGSNDLDLELRDAGDNVIESSRSSVNPQEKITKQVNSGVNYYVVVLAYETGGLDAPYDLTLNLDATTTAPPPNPPPPPPSTVTMNFSITDSCNDGFFTRFKFYDVDNSLVWPDSNTHYITPGLGIKSTKALACIPGAKICYGASLKADGGGSFWGLGLNGDQSCSSCCNTCTAGASVGRNLTC